jgi:hypothetical protein
MHWTTRESITEKLRGEITESQQKLSKLIERTILGKQEDPLEIFRARSLLEAKLNNAQKDLEIWLDYPLNFE